MCTHAATLRRTVCCGDWIFHQLERDWAGERRGRFGDQRCTTTTTTTTATTASAAAAVDNCDWMHVRRLVLFNGNPQRVAFDQRWWGCNERCPCVRRRCCADCKPLFDACTLVAVAIPDADRVFHQPVLREWAAERWRRLFVPFKRLYRHDGGGT